MTIATRCPCRRQASFTLACLEMRLTNRQVLADAERHQRDRYVGDPWEGVISNFIESRNEVTVAEILREALRMDTSCWGQTEQNRVARCLISSKWVRKQVRVGSGDKKEWRYRRPVTTGDEGPVESEHSRNVTTFRVVTGANR
jgi:hypothetical protein